MPVIDYTVVQTALGRSLSTAEQAQVTMWIDDAEVLIRTRLGDLAALDQDLLKYVVREAVVARVRRPDASTSKTVSVDDASVTTRFDGASANTEFITDAWWALLTPDPNDGAGGSWTIDPFASRRTS